jgi:hypothetical protein
MISDETEVGTVEGVPEAAPKPVIPKSDENGLECPELEE